MQCEKITLSLYAVWKDYTIPVCVAQSSLSQQRWKALQSAMVEDQLSQLQGSRIDKVLVLSKAVGWANHRCGQTMFKYKLFFSNKK